MELKEKCIYFAKSSFYDLIRDIGGVWNDSKERPIVCLLKLENSDLFWAIPIGNFNHRSMEAKERIRSYLNIDKRDIRSCFYHVGKTNETTIFFLSDVIPITSKYISREYLVGTAGYEIKNPNLISELERKLKRILMFESSKPNYFRQKITDLKKYLLNEN